MFALVSSLVFVGASAIAFSAVVETVRHNRLRIGDALHGRPLDRVRPALHAGA